MRTLIIILIGMIVIVKLAFEMTAEGGEQGKRRSARGKREGVGADEIGICAVWLLAISFQLDLAGELIESQPKTTDFLVIVSGVDGITKAFFILRKARPQVMLGVQRIINVVAVIFGFRRREAF